MKTFLQALKLFLLMTVLTGFIYPLAITFVAQKIFPAKANGSIVWEKGQENKKPIGSLLLSQKFESPKYFWPRPSSCDFNPIPSGASNLGPTSQDLKKQVDERRVKLGNSAPQDLITASGSGLDPHISPEGAKFQASRIAKFRNIPEKQVIALIDSLIEKRDFQLFGEPRVNVLKLNLALDGSP